MNQVGTGNGRVRLNVRAALRSAAGTVVMGTAQPATQDHYMCAVGKQTIITNYYGKTLTISIVRTKSRQNDYWIKIGSHLQHVTIENAVKNPQKVLNDLVYRLADLPEPFLGAADEIMLTSKPDPHDAENAKDLKTPGFAAAARLDRVKVERDKSLPDRYLMRMTIFNVGSNGQDGSDKGTILHESAHAFAFRNWGDLEPSAAKHVGGTKVSTTVGRRWDAAIRSDLSAAQASGRKDQGFPTEYGRQAYEALENTGEDFADSVWAYDQAVRGGPAALAEFHRNYPGRAKLLAVLMNHPWATPPTPRSSLGGSILSPPTW